MASLPPSPFEFGAPSVCAPDKAVVSDAPQALADTTADICDIGEIFVGAARLFDPDPAAYTSQDQAYYDLLRQLDDPHTPDLREMPYGMEGIFDPPPLFLREAAA